MVNLKSSNEDTEKMLHTVACLCGWKAAENV
jgi:hypothetical protein